MLETALARGITPSHPVWMVDLHSFEPWYTASLSRALLSHGVSLRLHCAPVAREPAYFQRQGLQQESGASRAVAAAARSRCAGRIMHSSVAASHTVRLLSHLRRGEVPRVLHLQMADQVNHGLRLDLALMRAAQRRGVPVVHTVHDVLPHDANGSMHRRYAELYACVDRLVCHSGEAARQLMTDFDVPASRLTIIPQGPLFAAESPASDEAQAQARVQLGLPMSAPVALWQGEVVPAAGVDVLLRAWKRLLSRWRVVADQKPLLVIAGAASSERSRLVMRLAEECGASVRLMLRYIRTDELPALHQAADVLVYPFRETATSGPLLTGLTYGKPIIASDVDAFRGFVVHEQNGLLVSPGDSDELADSLHTLLAPIATCHSGRVCCATAGLSCTCTRLLAGAKENFRRYTHWDAIAQATAVLYQRLLAAC